MSRIVYVTLPAVSRVRSKGEELVAFRDRVLPALGEGLVTSTILGVIALVRPGHVSYGQIGETVQNGTRLDEVRPEEFGGVFRAFDFFGHAEKANSVEMTSSETLWHAISQAVVFIGDGDANGRFDFFDGAFAEDDLVDAGVGLVFAGLNFGDELPHFKLVALVCTQLFISFLSRCGDD